MAKIKRLVALAGAAEFVRQWVRNNPDKAQQYIDKAGSVVDKRTQGKYGSKVQGATKAAKDAVNKEAGTAPGAGTTVPGSASTPSTPPAPGSTPGGPPAP